MKSKTKIEKQIKRKSNPELVKTIIIAKKNDGWLEIASILSNPRKKRTNVNLEKIDKETKEGETVVIPGKVLSQGELNKKIKIAALSFSKRAKEKLQKSKGKILSIIEEIEKNPTAKGIRILK